MHDPLQVLPCGCENEADFWRTEGYDTIVRYEDKQMGPYQLGLRFIILGHAWDKECEQMKVRRCHILAGAILERPTCSISQVQGHDMSELRPFGSPSQYVELDFGRSAVLRAALIPSFNLDILDAMVRAKVEGFHEFDPSIRRELVNACSLMSQFVRIMDYSTSFSKFSDSEGDKLLGIGEDTIEEVKHTMNQSKTFYVDRRCHGFLAHLTMSRSEYFQTTWCSTNGKFCWIDAPFDGNAVWEIVSAVRIQYKPATARKCHDGRLVVEARAANIEIKHSFPTAIRRDGTMDVPAGSGVRLRVHDLMEINLRTYATNSESLQADMGMSPAMNLDSPLNLGTHTIDPQRGG